jgi:5-methylthioadenosine/S-adenosylhomocysteine deaminase
METVLKTMDDTSVDILITGGYVVTMDRDRRLITNGAVAIRGDRIVAVGKAEVLQREYKATRHFDAGDKVIIPGLINSHVHVTAESLTKGFVPDDTLFEENVFKYLCPIHAADTPEEEYLAALFTATEMIKTGTTCFLEAGTVRCVPEEVKALEKVGIRAVIGKWIWDIPPYPEVYRQTTEEAISNLYETIERFRNVDNGRIKAWSMIIGHTTCTDQLMQEAKKAADFYNIGLNMHMSPAAMDTKGFLERSGRRPLEHLEKLGVLGNNVTLVHMIHVSDNELRIAKEHGVNIVHCPTTALRVAYGVTRIGKIPEMLALGINVCLGCDGGNAANYMDMLRATYLAAGLFKDARSDPRMIPAETAFEMATLNGARALLMEHEIGSLEAGKKADLVIFDTNRPEWRPLLNVANNLVYSADGKSVETVLIDGKVVVDKGRMTTVDEDALYIEVQKAAQALINRTGIPLRLRWKLE